MSKNVNVPYSYNVKKISNLVFITTVELSDKTGSNSVLETNLMLLLFAAAHLIRIRPKQTKRTLSLRNLMKQ